MAQTESVIYSFPANSGLYSRPFQDKIGALYGTEYYGPKKNGSVFQLVEAKGVWKEHSILRFDGRKGANPLAGLVQDGSGTLYGTTFYGGKYRGGTAFLLAPAGGGSWSETVLHDFGRGSDGSEPDAALFVGTTGIVYGTTSHGGGHRDCGTVFQLTQSGGTWTESTLHSFQDGSDGCHPDAALHLGQQERTLFGITEYGGPDNDGTVFMLKKKHAVWTESVLYGFTGGSDGAFPADVYVDQDENLYGVANSGGGGGYGVVFELTKHDSWQQSVLYSFHGSDGSAPVGMCYDKATRTFYGTTIFGGSYDDGTVFKLVSNGSSWTESLLHSFGSMANDGVYPGDRPIEDLKANVIYGTTLNGGQYGGGIVWAISP